MDNTYNRVIKINAVLKPNDKIQCQNEIFMATGMIAKIDKTFSGCSNILYLVSLYGKESNKKKKEMVLRFFQPSKFKCEGNFEQNILINICSDIVAFKNATLIPYIEGECPICDDSQLTQFKIMKPIAEKMAKIHNMKMKFSLDIEQNKNDIVPISVSDKINAYILNKTPISLIDDKIKNYYKFENGWKEIIKEGINNSLIWCCLCHMDLHSGNIINDAENKMHFIDWEYSAVSWNFLDISNFFAEATGINAELSYYPTKLVRYEFYKYYFTYIFNNIDNQDRKENINVDKKFLEDCDKLCMAFVPITFGFWALWANENPELESYYKNRYAVYNYVNKKLLDLQENEILKKSNTINRNPIFLLYEYFDQYILEINNNL